jgi:flagellar basal-body rod protein FlgB
MKIGLLDALGEKMRWHQTRQTLLAENVANADTPGYRGRDLKAFGFGEHMQSLSTVKVATTVTQPGHISIAGTAGTDGFGVTQLNNFEVTPEGNGVTLEDEMMKVAGNQIDYQSITALYTRSIKLIKTALGKQA